jgi:membrane-anchored protein YejM (alkaline phosphatase superfamily)
MADQAAVAGISPRRRALFAVFWLSAATVAAGWLLNLGVVRYHAWGRPLGDVHFILAYLSQLTLVVAVVGLAALLAGAAFDKAVYAWADVKGAGAVLVNADAIPFYVPVTCRWLVRRLGFKPEKRYDLSRGLGLHYPLAPLAPPERARRLNIVWIALEEWRADAFTPELCPRTWGFASRCLVADRHYSSGNASRDGIFGLFYGLHGFYWDSFLAEREGPVLLRLLKEAGYEVRAMGSASFRNPEFRKTCFVDLAAGVLDDLERRGLLENTVVVITGDHGQEFGEGGYIGHNSAFDDWQTHVPLILHHPGVKPGHIGKMTAHQDVLPTTLALLGSAADPAGYCLGSDILGPGEREYTVAASWNEAAMITADGPRVAFPLGAYRFSTLKVYDGRCRPLTDRDIYLARNAKRLREVLESARRFRR